MPDILITNRWIRILAVGALALVLVGRVALAQDKARERVLWQDDFESYGDTSEMHGGPTLLNRRYGVGTGNLNRWYGIGNGDHRGVELTKEFAHSGKQAALIYVDNAKERGNADIYLKLPKEVIAGKRRIAYQGWLAFDNLEAHRLILMCEFWTGQEKHYGQGPNKLLASVVEYDGPTRTWNKEVTDAHKPFDDGKRSYAQGLDKWHRFKLSCSFDDNRQYSFQFDDDTWQWEDLKLYVGDHPLDYTMLELNVRLYSPYESDPPPGGKLTARVAVDDVKITCED